MDPVATGFATGQEAVKVLTLTYYVTKRNLKEKNVVQTVDAMTGTHGARTVHVIMEFKPKAERAKMHIQLFRPVVVKLRPDIAE